MKFVLLFLLATSTLNVNADKNPISVTVTSELGKGEISIQLSVTNLTDDYVQIEAGKVSYVLKYQKDDSVMTKKVSFNFDTRLLEPKEEVVKTKSHLDVFINGGVYLGMESFQSELKSKPLVLREIKKNLKEEGYFAITAEGVEKDMGKLGKVRFVVEDKRVVIYHQNESSQKRRFSVAYNYLDLQKKDYVNFAKASSNIIVKIKPKTTARMSSLDLGETKFQLTEGEYYIRPIVFKNIKGNSKGFYYSFLNDDYGHYSMQGSPQEEVYVSDQDQQTSIDFVGDFLSR